MKKTIFAIICMIIFGITTYSAMAGFWNNDTSLLYYIPFENNLSDMKINSNIGTNNFNLDAGTSNYVAGHTGSAFYFDGSTELGVTASASSSLGSNMLFSISWWANYSSNDCRYFFDYGSTGSFWTRANAPDVTIALSDITGDYVVFYGGQFENTGWHHFVVSSNGTDLCLWEDGGLIESPPCVSTSTLAGGIMNSNGQWNWGSAYSHDCRLTGYIDEIRVYNTTLSNQQIYDLYTSNFTEETPPPSTAPTVDWDSSPEPNNSIHNHDLVMEFDLTVDDTANCSLFFDGDVTDSLTNIATGIYELNYTSNMSETGNHELYIECTNDAGTTQSTTKTLGFDFLLPTISLYQPIDGANIYRLDGLYYSILFENVQLDSVNVTFLQNGIVVNETGNIYVNQPTYNLTDVVSADDISVGDIDMIAWANHSAGGDSVDTFSFFLMDCPELVEDWTPQYSLCNTSDQQILTYVDDNSCNTFEYLPVGNNTISACNYCTGLYTSTTSGCVNDYIMTNYTYTNFATCCNVTNLPSDCNIPNNTQTFCGYYVGIHSSNEISGAVIDFGVEYGLFMITMVGVIAIVGMGIYFKKIVK